MPHGIMPDSARQEGNETTYGLINIVCEKDDFAGGAMTERYFEARLGGDRVKLFGVDGNRE
jgi:hypothetical protein